MKKFFDKYGILLAKIFFSVIWWGFFIVTLLAEIMKGLFSPIVLVQTFLWCSVWSGMMLSLEKET